MKTMKGIIKRILITCFCLVAIYSTTTFAASYSVASEYDFLDSSIKNNCVAFARYKVPSLPGGLGSLEEKKGIINSYSPVVGAIAISSGNSTAGHVSYVEAVNGNQIVTLNGGFMDNYGFTGHIERISGTASEQGIVGYWCPGGTSWYSGMTPANEGDDFYTPIIKAEGWIGMTDADGNVELTETYDGREMWHFVRQSDGSYVIYNCKSNRVLSTAPLPQYTNVIASSYNGEDNQKWFIYGRWSGEYYLKPKSSDKVLDVTGGSNAVGTNVQLYEYNGTGGQKIAFYKAEPAGVSTLSKTEGDSVHNTTFRWTKAPNATLYNLRIRKSVSGVMQDYKIVWSLTDTFYDIILPVGYYEVCVDSCNTFSFKTSNIVSFTIQEGQHSYTVETSPAGCTEAGKNVYVCSVCGDTYTEELPPIGHKWDDGMITREPTATTAGVRTYTCQVCQTTRTEEIPAGTEMPTPTPEATPAPETTPTPEATPAPEVTPVPETTPTPEVTPVPETTPVPEATPVPETTPVPEATPAPEMTPVPEATPMPETTPVPEATPTPETTPVPEATPAPEMTPTPEATPVPETTPVPEVTPAPETTPVPEATPAPEMTPTPEATPVPETTPVPEATPAPEMTPTPEATPAPEATPTPETTPVPEATPAPEMTPTPETTPTPEIPEATPTPDVPQATPAPQVPTQPGTGAVPQTPVNPGTGSTSQNTTTPSKTPSTSEKRQLPVGKTLQNISGGNYRVTGTGNVEFTKPVGKRSVVTIPAQIRVNGISYQVTSIAANAFRNNKKLRKVKIGPEIQKIGANAFRGCKNLKSILVETEKLKKNRIGKKAFSGINKKAVFKISVFANLKTYKKVFRAKGAPSTAKYRSWYFF